MRFGSARRRAQTARLAAMSLAVRLECAVAHGGGLDEQRSGLREVDNTSYLDSDKSEHDKHPIAVHDDAGLEVAHSASRLAFEALILGRQREHNLFFSDAKQAKTPEARIEKCAQKILDGKGFRDR